MDGVKSWLSKSKSSTKNLSDDGSPKSSRSVDASRGSALSSEDQAVGGAVGGASVPRLTSLAANPASRVLTLLHLSFFSKNILILSCQV